MAETETERKLRESGRLATYDSLLAVAVERDRLQSENVALRARLVVLTEAAEGALLVIDGAHCDACKRRAGALRAVLDSDTETTP